MANCSGFYGDRLAAAKEMVEGGPSDVLTGDWLAELTRYSLHKTRQRSGGYAGTFLRQMEEVKLATCLERGIKVVANAGGLDPVAAARAPGARALALRQGVEVRVASVAGDDLMTRIAELGSAGEGLANLDTGEALPDDAALVTANAYLGAAPIAAALGAGADVVVTGRVTDASLVVGPAIWAFGWGPEDLDQLAGAVVAGHVIECGAQCCGGNYAFFDEVPGMDRVGFPLAELSADGSSVITKHPGTGGAVTGGTVTAQLLYEIGGPRYLSPDAVARFDTVTLEQVGPDRVRVSGTRGEPLARRTLKAVTANLAGGWRNAVTFVLTGDRVAAKAALAEAALWEGVPGGRAAFAETAVELFGDLTGAGEAFLRVAVRGDDQALVGRTFSSAAVETALSTFPGAFYTGPPSGRRPGGGLPSSSLAWACSPPSSCRGSPRRRPCARWRAALGGTARDRPESSGLRGATCASCRSWVPPPWSLFVTWLFLLVLGVGLIRWCRRVRLPAALGMGSSVFTLGIVSSNDAGPRAIEVMRVGHRPTRDGSRSPTSRRSTTSSPPVDRSRC